MRSAGSPRAWPHGPSKSPYIQSVLLCPTSPASSAPKNLASSTQTFWGPDADLSGPWLSPSTQAEGFLGPVGAVIMCLRLSCFPKALDLFPSASRRCGLMPLRRFCITRSSSRTCLISGHEPGPERALAGAGLSQPTGSGTAQPQPCPRAPGRGVGTVSRGPAHGLA